MPDLSAEIYVIEQPDGSVRITNRAPEAGEAARVYSGRTAGYTVIRGRSGHLVRAGLVKYRELITAAARINGIEESLLKAVIHAESSFYVKAVSAKGAIGLMQLMPATIKDLGIRDPFDAGENVYAGTRYLASLIDRFNGDTVKALAAYNAGPEAVMQSGGVPPFAETRRYIGKVLALRARYRAE